MPVYEYRCRTCDGVFEVRRPASQSGAAADCPGGHTDTVRLFSVFARSNSATAPAPSAPSGGGCCGGACGCGH